MLDFDMIDCLMTFERVSAQKSCAVHVRFQMSESIVCSVKWD
jgi:hypothetical protein